MESIQNFFDSQNFMPHGHCFLWQPDIFWLHLLSDLGIVSAYFAIPFALIYILRKRKDLPFENIFLLFAAFILLCGTTHAMNIWVLWNPDYAVEGVIKALTAITSIATFFAILHFIPRILSIPSSSQLAVVNEQLQRTSRELEAQLTQSKENSASRLQAIVNTILDGLIIIDDKGEIESFNPAAEKIFGFLQDEVAGRNVHTLMPEPYHSEHDGYLKNYIKTGEAKVIGIGREVSGRRKDGSIFPMELGVNEMRLGGQRMFVGTVRDISERKKAEESLRKSEERYELAVKGLSVGIWDWDIPVNGLYWSWRFKEIIQCYGEELKDDYYEWENRLHPNDREHTLDRLQNHLRTQEPYDVEYRLKRKDGSYAWIHAKGQAVWDSQGNPTRMVGSIEDITWRKEAEQAIQDSMAALKRSNQELDDFAYIASHDLKEPLRGLSNNANFLKEDFAAILNEAGISRLDRMIFLCERLERLVNDLLYFSRLGRQDLAIQPTNLNDVIADIESLLETTLHETNTTIQIIDTLPTIICDLPRMTEVFRNLITNAIKYNDKPVRKIEIGCMLKNSERVYFVRDNGIGIPPQYFDEIFRIFKRLNDEDDKVKGTGVGLTFVKKIIERHRGRIWVESTLGKGTTFYFTIPELKGANE